MVTIDLKNVQHAISEVSEKREIRSKESSKPLYTVVSRLSWIIIIDLQSLSEYGIELDLYDSVQLIKTDGDILLGIVYNFKDNNSIIIKEDERINRAL